jgi:hypothetical protein
LVASPAIGGPFCDRLGYLWTPHWLGREDSNLEMVGSEKNKQALACSVLPDQSAYIDVDAALACDD